VSDPQNDDSGNERPTAEQSDGKREVPAGHERAGSQITTSKGQEETHKKQQHQWPWRQWPSWSWELRFSALAFVAECITAVLAIGGFAVVVYQLALMRESNDLTRQDLHASNRPWIMLATERPVSMSLEGFPGWNEDQGFTAGHRLRIAVQLKNSGNSPAIRTLSVACLRIEETVKADYRCSAQPGMVGSTGIVGPDEDYGLMLEFALSNSQVGDLADGKTGFWVFATVEYHDQFTPEHIHRSEFCLQKAYPPPSQWLACPGWNTAD